MSIYPPFLGPSTEEQRQEALRHTRDTLQKLRDVLKELDLPASEIKLAAKLYSINLGGALFTAEQTKAKERSKRRRAKIMAQYPQGIIGQPQVTPFGGLVPNNLAEYVLDDDDDD